MRHLGNDILWTLRSWRKNPAFIVFAMLSLALGIGANTAIFSAVKAILLNPLPVEEPSRLVSVFATFGDTPGVFPISYAEYQDIRQGAEVFEDLLLYRPARMVLTEGEAAEMVDGTLVSGNYFDLLGVRPALGRFFGADEQGKTGAVPVVVLSHDFWLRRFGGDRRIVERTVTFNSQPFQVIGVAERGFRGLAALTPSDVWVPVANHEQVLFGTLREWFDLRDGRIFLAAGRLGSDTGLEGAQAAATMVARRLEEDYPETNEKVGLEVMPLTKATISPNRRGGFVKAGAGLMIGVGLLLLTATANVANLLLSRAVSRHKEIAVRLSLGASRQRVLQQLLTEGLMLALAGGVAVVVLAYWCRGLLWSLRPPDLPESMRLSLDLPVLLLTALVCLLVGVIFGVAPLSQVSRTDLRSAFQGDSGGAAGTPRKQRLREILVVAQVALSVVALIGVGLLLRSYQNAQRLDLGFDADRVMLLSVDLGPRGFTPAQGQGYYQQVVERVETLPGIASAALAERVPLVPRGFRIGVQLDGEQPPPDAADYLVPVNTVGPRYFSTLGIPLVAGREFAAEDREQSGRVAIVNQRMVELFWRGVSPVGKHFRFTGEQDLYRVVGVVADSTTFYLGEEPLPNVYVALGQSYNPQMTLHVRTASDPGRALETVRREVARVDREVPLYDVCVLSDLVSDQLWATRLSLGLLSLFGLLALTLTTIGTYAVISLDVQQRRREIAVRMAFGGQPSGMVRLILRGGARMVLAGVAAGLLIALAAGRLVATLLYGLQPVDLVSYAAAAALLATVALTAGVLAAFKAAGVAPMLVLRSH